VEAVEQYRMNNLYSINIPHIIKSIREEGWAFIFICVYLFFEYVRPQSLYPQINIIPWVDVIITITFVIAILNNEFGKRSFQAIDKLMIIFAIVVLLSSFMSYYPDTSFANWRTFFNWFIIYFLIVGIITNERRFFIFFLSFLLYSFKMSQHGFRSWAQRGFGYADWGVAGAPGWFHNSGEVGIQMCIFTPMAIAFIFAVYKYISKPWLYFFLLMPLTSVGTAIASSSRATILGLAGAGGWSILRRPKTVILGGLFLAVVAVVVMQVMPEPFAERFETMGEDRTSTHRLERWGDGLQAMNHNPLFGVGFTAWSEYYPRNFILEDKGSLLVHNIFIQCGTELGYIGLIVFLALIVACFLITKKVRKIAKNHDDRFFYMLSFGFDAALVGFIVNAAFVTVLYYPYFWIHCALTTSLYTALINKYSEEETQISNEYISQDHMNN
jgi:O-antigen ligase